MKSLNTLDRIHNSKGFTLVEILITLGIFLLVSTVAIVVGLDSYQRVNFRSDVATAAALLQKARSSAMSNVNETRHGVYFGNAKDYVLFQGTAYSATEPNNLSIDHSAALVVTPANTSIIFSQLSGTTTATTLTFTQGGLSTTIVINDEGGITW